MKPKPTRNNPELGLALVFHGWELVGSEAVAAGVPDHRGR